MTTAADTKRDLDRMRRQVARMNADILTSVTQDAYESIVVGRPETGSRGQPVDTGYLRNSWTLFDGEVGDFRSAGDTRDNRGTTDQPLPPPAANPAVLIKLAQGQTARVTIATNTAYAEVQEWRHPVHAGAVRLTVAGLGALATKAFRQVTAAIGSVR